jgi:DNA polymerase I
MAKAKPAKKKAHKTLVLLDAHAILHRAYHALPAFSSPTGEPTGALYGVVAMLIKIIEELRPDYIAAAFDLPEKTYRHHAFEGYKAKRAKLEDDLAAQIDRSRDIFEAFGIRIYECPGFEADDMLGTIVEQTRGMQELEVIIASGDMDTLQLIEKTRVKVYTLRKGIKDTIMYDEKGVKERYGFGPLLIPDYKGLRGDPSDNIPGIAGIGEKMATTLITTFGGVDALYKKLKKDEDAFVRAGLRPRIIELLKNNREEAEFSKMLATIRRDAPVTFTLPEKTWREKLDLEKVLALFAELGFRTLGARVKSLFGGEDVDVSSEGVVYDEAEVRKTAIALWLLESDVTNPTVDDIEAYARERNQPHDFASAQKLILEDLTKEKLDTVYKEIELPLIEVLDAMQKKGVLIDVAYLKTLSKKFNTELAKLEKEIYKLAGTEFNVNSPKQMGDILYDTLGLAAKNQKRTATGQRSTRESELEKLRDVHPIIPKLLRYRELQKLTSTYVDNLPGLVAKDGRIHTTFLQAGAVTGRMATTNPGLQNIPIRTDEGRAIRRAFIAPEGYTLVSIDYSQIDLRAAAILSGDEKLVDIFKRGEDVHQGVAVRVFSVDADKVTPEMRRRAKVINFGILYGMGVNALRQNLGHDTPREEAQEFLNAYFNTFTRLAEYLEEVKTFARKHGYTETLFGRRRHFPGINSGAPFIRAEQERRAINAPIQGTSADIIRIAMVKIHKYLTEKKQEGEAAMLLQVHDELVFEIKTKSLEKLIPELVSRMTDVIPKEKSNGVPVAVEVKVGSNWEEMEKWKQ